MDAQKNHTTKTKSFHARLAQLCVVFVVAAVFVVGATVAFGTDAIQRIFTNATSATTQTASESQDVSTDVSKTATNLDENYESQVTLSIPKQDSSYDVVFVCDKSASTDEDIDKQFSSLMSLIEAGSNDVKVGIVAFYKDAKIVKTFDEDTKEDLCGYCRSGKNENKTSGTNLPAGIQTGTAMLDEDQEVTADHKYLIVISDGDTHVFNKDNEYNSNTDNVINQGAEGSTATVVTYASSAAANATIKSGPDSFSAKYGSFEISDTWDWDSYFEQISDELKDDNDAYDYDFDINGKNGTNGAYANSNYIPYDEISKHACSVDKSLYYSLVNYQNAQGKGYQTYAIGTSSGYGRYYGASFMNYLNTAKSVAVDGNNYEDISVSGAQNVFDLVEDRLSTTDEGTYVEDVMGAGTDNAGNAYNIDFVNDISRIDATFNGEVLTKQTNSDGSYSFGTDDDPNMFTLMYHPAAVDSDGNETTSDSFTWSINKKAYVYDSIQLIYYVKLTNPQTKAGAYGVYDEDGSNNEAALYTNTSATLYRDDGSTQVFPQPTVSYTVDRLTTSVSVKKKFDDADNQDGVRPDSVSLQLFANGTAYEDPISVSADNNWTYTWDDLDADITYTVEETDVPDGYTATVSGSAEDGFTITNTHVPEICEVSVSKMWVDQDDQDGIRPQQVSVQLYADGTKYGKAVELSLDDGWSYTWSDLAAKSGGTDITYTVEETDVPDGYTATVLNSGDNQFVISNKHTPSTLDVTAVKVFDDADNQDGIRPDSVSLQLLADGTAYEDPISVNADNNWAYIWSGLAVKSGGTDITYTVEETDVPDGYTATVSGSAEDGFTITNTHIPETCEVSGSKTWDDEDNQDGIRPESITINLFGDGTKIDSAQASAENGWTWSFTDLPKYAGGNEIVYAVTEDAVEGYTPTYDGYNIENSYTPELTSVTVNKAWDDQDDQDGVRPQQISVQLYADGLAYGDVVELSADDGWVYTWTGLDAKSDGIDISYTVEEIDAPDGYTSIVSGSADDGFTITNTYKPETTSVSVIKVWKGDNDSSTRPESITVRLYADGVASGDTVTLSADNAWAATFENLAAYAGGEKVKYTITEDEVDNYTATITGSMSKGYKVTNTLISQTETLVTSSNKTSTSPKKSTSKKTVSATTSSKKKTTTITTTTINDKKTPTSSGKKLTTIDDEDTPTTAAVDTGDSFLMMLYAVEGFDISILIAIAALLLRRRRAEK